GGNVTASGGEDAAGIGGGWKGSGGTITIHGGSVTATGGGSAAGIGGEFEAADSGSFATGTDGHALIVANGGIGDKRNQKSWSGMIFEGNTRTVYGQPTIQENIEISIGQNADRTGKHHPDREGRRDPHQ
ncbi:MAG: hypothetical protein ACLRZ3_12445, partial [Flavonifractor plautii]